MDRGDAFIRLRRGGLTRLIAGEEQTKSKAWAGGSAALLFVLHIPRIGILLALAAVVTYSVIWGFVIRFRKPRAGVPLDSIEY
jgi:hypothetical protein